MMTDRAARYVKLILSVILFASIARIYFLLINISLFKSFSVKEVFNSVLKGVWADVPVILALNLIFAIVYFVPKTAIFQNKKIPVMFLSAVFWVVNLPLIFISLFNAEYYKLAGERIDTISYASMAKMGEFQSISSHLIPRLLLITLIVLMFVLLTRKYFYKQKEVYLSGLRQMTYLVFFVSASVFCLGNMPTGSEVGRDKIEPIKKLSLHYLEKNSLEDLIKNTRL